MLKENANVNYTAKEARAPTVFHDIELTISNAAEVAARVEALADRFCGQRPPEKDGVNGISPPSGVFGALRYARAEIDSSLARVAEALARIESELP